MQFPALNRRLLVTEKRLAHISDSVIAVSKSVKQQLMEVYGVNEEKVHVIHNGVESGQYSPSLTRENVILYVGRQTAHKGLTFLLQGFAKFAQDHSEYKLVLVGERLEGGVDPSLVKLAERLGMSNRIKFTGRLPDPQLRNILGRARCLVLPSLAESFGMTVLEAMASETPVIATNVGGIPELIDHGRNGLLVPPVNPNAIASSLDRIVTHAELRRKLVREGRRTAEQFSWDKVAQATIQVYGEVCS
jgi:glycosyltransferase involved in cell wall biosynthesis